MKILFRAPGLPEPDLVDYLTDAVRPDSLLQHATPIRVVATAWRGSSWDEMVSPEPPVVSSWTSDSSVASSFGPHVRSRSVHWVLAIVWHDDDGGWIEYVTRRVDSLDKESNSVL